MANHESALKDNMFLQRFYQVDGVTDKVKDTGRGELVVLFPEVFVNDKGELQATGALLESGGDIEALVHRNLFKVFNNRTRPYYLYRLGKRAILQSNTGDVKTPSVISLAEVAFLHIEDFEAIEKASRKGYIVQSGGGSVLITNQ